MLTMLAVLVTMLVVLVECLLLVLTSGGGLVFWRLFVRIFLCRLGGGFLLFNRWPLFVALASRRMLQLRALVP